MAREKRPSFPFYPKDWLGSASVSSMPLAAQGLYIRLLAFAWLSDGLPSDEDALRRLAGVDKGAWGKLWPVVEPLWQVVDGRLQNRKLETVREEATAYSEARALAGQKGGRARSTGQANGKQTASKPEANGQAKTKPSSSSASSSSSSTSSDDDDTTIEPPQHSEAGRSSRPEPLGRFLPSAMDVHAAWAAAMPGVAPERFADILEDGRRRLARFARDCGSIDAVEAFCARVAASDYLAGRLNHPPMNLFDAIAKADRIMAGSYDNRATVDATPDPPPAFVPPGAPGRDEYEAAQAAWNRRQAVRA